MTQEKTARMIVGLIERQGERTLLQDLRNRSSRIGFHVFANPKDCQGIKVGDVIEYQPYGVNFGWFVRKVEVAMDNERRPEYVLAQCPGKATVIRSSSINVVRVDDNRVSVLIPGSEGFEMDCRDHEEAIVFARHVAFAMGMSREDADKIGV